MFWIIIHGIYNIIQKGKRESMPRSKVRTSAPPNPMVDNEKIERTIIAKGYSLAEFAEMLGLCYHTLRARLDDGRWTVKEAWEVCTILDIPLVTFFAYPEKLLEVA